MFCSFFALGPGLGRRQGRGGGPAALAAAEPAIRPASGDSAVSLQLRTIAPSIEISLDRSQRKRDTLNCRTLEQRPTLTAGERAFNACEGLLSPQARGGPCRGTASRTNGPP